MKNNKRFLYAVVVSAVIIAVTCAVWIYRPLYTVPILTYHSVAHQDDLITVTPDNFDRQLKYLKDNGYDVISLDTLVSGIKANRRFNRKSVVITFDDGREDNYQYAYPILKKYHFPVMIFLASGKIGSEKGFLSWDEVSAMTKDNISFGAHTVNHAFLASLGSDETLQDEIVGSKKMIEGRIGVSVDYFSYPHGAFNENVKSIVKRAGYKGSCTTNVGPGRLNQDVYALKRIRVKNSDMNKPFSFRAKLSGYYNLFRRPRLEVEP